MADDFEEEDSVGAGGGDDFDLNKEPGHMPIPGAVPEPFVQSDELRLNKLQQGLSAVRQARADATLGEKHADYLERSILSEASPLAQRKKQFQEQQAQELEQKIMRQAGLQHSIVQSNAIADAGNFGQRMYTHHDPLSGKEAAFYQTSPGNWDQVDFGEPAPVSGAEGLGDTSPAADTGESGVTGGLPTMGTEGAGQGSGEGAPLSPRAGANISVWNGPNRTVGMWDGEGNFVGQKQYDQLGQEVKPNGGITSMEGMLHPAETAEIWRRAALSIPLPPGPHRDVAVKDLAIRMAQGLIAQRRFKMQAAENERRQQAQVAEHERQEKVREAAKERRERDSKAWKEVADEFHDARTKVSKGEMDKLPGHLATPEARRAEAYRRASEEEDFHKLMRGEQPTGSAGGQSQPKAVPGLTPQQTKKANEAIRSAVRGVRPGWAPLSPDYIEPNPHDPAP